MKQQRHQPISRLAGLVTGVLLAVASAVGGAQTPVKRHPRIAVGRSS